MKHNRISITIPNELLKQSDKIAKEKAEDRSTVIRGLLTLGIQQHMVEKALKMYRDGKASLEKAAEVAQVSLWKFMEILKDKRIPLRYDVADMKKEIKDIYL
jgi:predicted HTH domain antitoxin